VINNKVKSCRVKYEITHQAASYLTFVMYKKPCYS